MMSTKEASAVAVRKMPRDGSGWSLLDISLSTSAYKKGAFRALASLYYVKDEGTPPHWVWLVSFSHRSRRPMSDVAIRRCLEDFDALDFEEDNHEPGFARKFWLAVDPQYRVPCACKKNEEQVWMDKNYVYSRKRSPKGGADD